jgi:predicted aspartyl protease
VLLHNKCPHSSKIYLKNSATFINLNLKGKVIKTLVDSGAESTLISKRLADQLKLKVLPDEENVLYIAANGQPLKNMGWTLLHFKMGQFEMTQRCIIIDKLSVGLLLGTDVLANYDMVINYKDHTLSVGNISVKICTKTKQTCSS